MMKLAKNFHGEKFPATLYTVTVYYSFVPMQLGHSGWTHVFNINVTRRTWGEVAIHAVYYYIRHTIH